MHHPIFDIVESTSVLTIDFELKLHGCATLTVGDGKSSVQLTDVNYIDDALGNLIRSAVQIDCGAYQARVEFIGEPGLSGLLLKRVEKTLSSQPIIDLQVVDTLRPYEDLSAPDATKLLQLQVTPEQFAWAVLKTGKAVWEEFGADGYLERWHYYPFPLRALRALEAALAHENLPTEWRNC